MKKTKLDQRALVACMGLLGASACEGAENTPALGGDLQNIMVACPPPAGPPERAWVCPAPLTVECGAAIPPLYVSSDPAQGPPHGPPTEEPTTQAASVLVTTPTGLREDAVL